MFNEEFEKFLKVSITYNYINKKYPKPVSKNDRCFLYIL